MTYRRYLLKAQGRAGKPDWFDAEFSTDERALEYARDRLATSRQFERIEVWYGEAYLGLVAR